jgi:hypothetical protein
LQGQGFWFLAPFLQQSGNGVSSPPDRLTGIIMNNHPWALLAIIATPAFAQGTTSSTGVPEPADFVLFALGAAGLLVGRRAARKSRSAKAKTLSDPSKRP